MAIPLSNEMREVQAPRTAELKPIDNQQFLQSMGNAALGMNRQMQETIRGGFKVAQQIRDQQDAFKRNEAERIYNERTTELNMQLAQKEGQERVKFQPKYEAEMKLASDTYEAAINKVHNFEIREGSKRSINAWNNRNASNYQYENYKNETKLQEQAMGQALITDNEKRINSITAADSAKSLSDYANDPNLGFAHGEQMLRDFYGNRMGYPQEVVDQYVKDYKSKGAIAMANRLAQVTDGVSTTASYNQSLNFIDQGIKEGIINASEGIEAKRTLELQKIDMVAEINPGSLINNDGTYNFNAARRYAPDLTQKELYQHISASSKGRGGSGVGFMQEQLSQLAVDNWNDMVYKAGWGAELATDDYRDSRADLIAQKRKASGKAIVDLIQFANFGDSLLNGVAIVNEDGTYTDPKTGVTTQTVATGTKRILQKQNFNELNKKVNEAKYRIANLMDTGAYKDIFTPEVFKAAPSMSDKDRAVLANLQLLYKAKGGKNDGWLSTKIKNVLEATHLKHYEATGGVGAVETMSNIRGTQIGIGEATKKYGFDPEHIGNDQLKQQVNLKQYNSKTGLYEDIPGMAPVTMETALNMEIGYATLQQMDDGMFQSIYGANAKKPENLSEMQHYGNYKLDWSGESSRTVSSALNSAMGYQNLERIGNAFMPFYGTLSTSFAKTLEINEPAPFGFTDAQAYEALSKVGNTLKKGFASVAYTGTAMPEKQFQDMQFTNTVFSGKPNNEPLTYDEFITQEGAATPDTYSDYLADRGNYLRTLGVIEQTRALSKDNPGAFFVVNSQKTDSLLSDMYAKASGMAPSNPKYISEDIEVGDIFASGGLTELKAPVKAFDMPEVKDNVNSDIVMHNAPMFFLRKNGNGFVLHNGNIKMLDCNASEFVTLLGIAQGMVDQQPNVSTSVSGIPANMISNQFKVR